jgi:hypothetical protein
MFPPQFQPDIEPFFKLIITARWVLKAWYAFDDKCLTWLSIDARGVRGTTPGHQGLIVISNLVTTKTCPECITGPWLNGHVELTHDCRCGGSTVTATALVAAVICLCFPKWIVLLFRSVCNKALHRTLGTCGYPVDMVTWPRLYTEGASVQTHARTRTYSQTALYLFHWYFPSNL